MNTNDYNEIVEKWEEISMEDEKFIKRYLDYSDGRVDIGGWLTVQLSLLAIQFPMLIYLVVVNLKNYSFNFDQTVSIGSNIALMILTLMIFSSSSKRKKNTIAMFKILYGISIITALWGLTLGASRVYSGLIGCVGWLIYFFVSKRVKYTYTKY